MKLNKVVIRSDGTQYKIKASIYIDFYRNTKPVYSFEVVKKEKRKRKWLPVYDFDSDYKWRSMNMDKRTEFCERKYLDFVTKDEVNQVFKDIHESIKPVYL